MDFAFSDEQQMLRSSARDYLADRFPIDRVIELSDGEAGWDPASWPQLGELGWLGLSVPASHGGADMSFLDEAVLFEEAGAALLPGPLFATVGLALPALHGAKSLLAEVVAGRRSATLAWAEEGGSTLISDTDGVSCRAHAAAADQGSADPGWRLTGTKRLVPDLAAVTDVVVVARADGDVGLWRVDLTTAPSQSVRSHATMDRTRRLGDLVVQDTPAHLLVEPGAAQPVLDHIRHRAMAALACEAVGVAQRCLSTASEYARTRQQFGRPIGTYQGVSHRIANIYLALELARSLAYWAAWGVSVGDASVPLACAAAKSAAGEAAVSAAENAIQAMGGVGFTWDHPLHRYYKRAQSIDAFEGYGREHRRDIAAALLDA